MQCLQKQGTGKAHSEAMVIGLIQSLIRLVGSLKSDIIHTDWSHYDRNNSYQIADIKEKKIFVERHTENSNSNLVWDIGSNTGAFSKIASVYAKQVVSLDSDQDSIEQLYLDIKQQDSSNIFAISDELSKPVSGTGLERIGKKKVRRTWEA